MKILVLGGSYFAGRIFCMLASREGHELTLINRGKYSMAHLPGVKNEIKCDRDSIEGLRMLPAGEYDAIVDFCAYNEGEIKAFLDNAKIRAGRYIFISTADVHERTGEASRNEDTPLISENPGGPAGDYVYNKMLLERELAAACASRGMKYTILRPAFIYGPYNYAPRESLYIRNIIQGRPVPVPVDADGRFTMVYVEDVAGAVLLAASDPSDENRIYELSGPQILDYVSFTDMMEKAGDAEVVKAEVTVAMVLNENIPLPFPLEKKDDEVFDGSRITEELGLSYTPLEKGMKDTFNAFAKVYG